MMEGDGRSVESFQLKHCFDPTSWMCINKFAQPLLPKLGRSISILHESSPVQSEGVAIPPTDFRSFLHFKRPCKKQWHIPRSCRNSAAQRFDLVVELLAAYVLQRHKQGNRVTEVYTPFSPRVEPLTHASALNCF